MATRTRALAGTPAAYERCARCLHARVRHEESGAGQCSQSSTIADTTTPGTITARVRRCLCPRFQTTEELF